MLGYVVVVVWIWVSFILRFFLCFIVVNYVDSVYLDLVLVFVKDFGWIKWDIFVIWILSLICLCFSVLLINNYKDWKVFGIRVGIYICKNVFIEVYNM